MSGSLLGPDLGVDLPLALAELGQPADALDALGIPASPWLDAARALLAGDARQAAAVYRAIGARPDEADARMAAARQLFAAGHTAEAEVELDAATAFWNEVGATSRLREIARSRD